MPEYAENLEGTYLVQYNERSERTYLRSLRSYAEMGITQSVIIELLDKEAKKRMAKRRAKNSS